MRDISVKFEIHPTTSSLQSITLHGKATLNLSDSAKNAGGCGKAYSKVYEVVSYPPVIAAASYGYGKIAAIGDSEGMLSENENSKKFLSNVFSWLTVKPNCNRGFAGGRKNKSSDCKM